MSFPDGKSSEGPILNPVNPPEASGKTFQNLYHNEHMIETRLPI
jgi:hypothetical protein